MKKRRRIAVIGGGLAVMVGVWIFRAPLQDRIRESATLSNDSPPQEVVENMISQSVHPEAALLAAWNSGKIVHREVAMSSIRRVFDLGRPLPAEIESILLAGALDPDMNVREAALGILDERKHRDLLALAAEQLKDPDQQVRLLGLRFLKTSPAEAAMPVVASLLTDPDIAVLGTSLKLLERWSGQSFGTRLADTIQVENEATGLPEFEADGIARTQAAAGIARAWWAEHQGSTPPVTLRVPAAALSARKPLPAGDFLLRDMQGRKVRLSDYRGSVVLINFWTTWCTACAGEMPALVALQERHRGTLVVLGVSLDFVPDSHGHGNAIDAEGEAGRAVDSDAPEATRIARKRLLEKVARIVEVRHVNYPILLDEKNEVGGRFNGGELPTTVIVDAQGNVRRRFVGARSLPVFEAMLSEAGID